MEVANHVVETVGPHISENGLRQNTNGGHDQTLDVDAHTLEGM
jgi:hypothetical protein